MDERLPIVPFSSANEINCLMNEGDQIVKNNKCVNVTTFNYLVLNEKQKTLKINTYSPLGNFQNTINYANDVNEIIIASWVIDLRGNIRLSEVLK